jgi:hypothetical protein
MTNMNEHTLLTDDELLTKALVRPQIANPIFIGARPAPCFFDFWYRNVTVLALAFPPQFDGQHFDYSSADVMFAKELVYWTGRDAARIERLMRASAMRRNKWNVADYLANTIAAGCMACDVVYQRAPQPVERKLLPQVMHATFVSGHSLETMFSDCVYVVMPNAILMPNGDMLDMTRFNARFGGYTFSMDSNNERTTKKAWNAFLFNQMIAFPRADDVINDSSLAFQEVVERSGRKLINTHRG